MSERIFALCPRVKRCPLLEFGREYPATFASTLQANFTRVKFFAFLWEDSDYCWVVICKNWGHLRQSIFHGHRTPLGVSDAVAACPVNQGQFPVRCDLCGKEYLYKRRDIFRYEQMPRESFIAHPLFKQED
jgi:hypothetical protein